MTKDCDLKNDEMKKMNCLKKNIEKQNCIEIDDIYVKVCMYIYVYTDAYIYLCSYTYIFIYTYAYLKVCM
jgi:hypothetical protein